MILLTSFLSNVLCEKMTYIDEGRYFVLENPTGLKSPEQHCANHNGTFCILDSIDAIENELLQKLVPVQDSSQRVIRLKEITSINTTDSVYNVDTKEYTDYSSSPLSAAPILCKNNAASPKLTLLAEQVRKNLICPTENLLTVTHHITSLTVATDYVTVTQTEEVDCVTSIVEHRIYIPVSVSSKESTLLEQRQQERERRIKAVRDELKLKYEEILNENVTKKEDMKLIYNEEIAEEDKLLLEDLDKLKALVSTAELKKERLETLKTILDKSKASIEALEANLSHIEEIKARLTQIKDKCGTLTKKSEREDYKKEIVSYGKAYLDMIKMLKLNLNAIDEITLDGFV